MIAEVSRVDGCKTPPSARLRTALFFAYAHVRGHQLPRFYYQQLYAMDSNRAEECLQQSLSTMLLHCREQVPYYAKLMSGMSTGEIRSNPAACLEKLPCLTKQLIRDNFDALKSKDLDKRKWFFNTSGGSTGEPIRLIQDREFADRTQAITMYFERLMGRHFGERVSRLWGSEREVLQGTRGLKSRLFAKLTNDSYMNAFMMTRAKMLEYLAELNRRPPKQIVAYAQSIYELAKFATAEGIEVVPQQSIVTSAGTLYDFMRSKIQEVFHCPVYNRYGSREVGFIASEVPGIDGLWVAPTGNYVEILDEWDWPLQAPHEGNIVVTCMTNFAMPLIRYKIGDRGCLVPSGERAQQVLARVSGRVVDAFKTRNGTLIDGEYFTHLLYFRDWLRNFQVVQKDYDEILIRVVADPLTLPSSELEEISAGARIVMGSECQVKFDFVDAIEPSPSGKFRYTMCEIS